MQVLVNQIKRQIDALEELDKYFPDNRIPHTYTVLKAFELFASIKDVEKYNGCITMTDDGNIIIEWTVSDWENTKPEERASICIGIDEVKYSWWERVFKQPKLPKLQICAVYTKALNDSDIKEELTFESCRQVVEKWLESNERFLI